MKKKVRKSSILIGMVGVIALILTAGLNSSLPTDEGTRAMKGTLTSKLVSTGPTVDGDAADPVWDDADPISIPVEGGANFPGEVDVSLRSVYTDTTVYFLAEWDDPEDSYERFPWVFNTTDSKWEHLGDMSSHDENDYYEDKFSIIWNVDNSIADFNTAGCTVVCHTKKYTSSPDERGDTWHWKRVRTNFVGQLDDKYLNDDESNGRKSDPKTGGGYKNNEQTLNYQDDPANSTTVPKLYYPAGEYFGAVLLADNGTEAKYIAEVYENQSLRDVDGNWIEPDASTKIPGIIVSAFQGDRGDVKARGVWTNGKWSLEISRELDTGSEYDIQFDDLTDLYYFSVAAFDNSQIDHSHAGASVYSLRFEDVTPPAAVSGLTATTGEGNVTLVWNSIADAASYKVFVSTSEITDPTSPGVTLRNSTSSTSYVVSGLTEGTEYHFAVMAVDQAGNEGSLETGSLASATLPVTEDAEADDSGNTLLYIVILIIIIAVIAAVVVLIKRRNNDE